MSTLVPIVFGERRPQIGEHEITLLQKIADKTRCVQGTLFPSAARSAANTASPTMLNHDCRGVIITLTVTAKTTGNIAITAGYQDINGNGITFAIGANSAVTGVTALAIYPGLVPVSAALTQVNFVLPRNWYCAVSTDGSSWTWQLNYDLIP